VTCDEVRDLLPAYALGIVELDENEAVEAHLRDCRDHDAELVDLRATSFALELLREDIELPPGLHESIERIPTRDAGRGRSWRPRWWIATAAVVALFAIFGAGWLANSVLRDTEPSTSIELRYTYALQGSEGELVRLSGIEGDDEVTVIMSGLERLPEGRLYRLWAIRGGEWLRIGQCNTNEQGGWVGDFAFALNPGDELAVTIEAPSADPQPRGEPILSSSASS
jgi:hypothetical protein